MKALKWVSKGERNDKRVAVLGCTFNNFLLPFVLTVTTIAPITTCRNSTYFNSEI